MAPSDIARADLNQLVAQLTQDEAIALTAGVGFWHTAAIPRLNIPAVKVSRRILYNIYFHLIYYIISSPG
jgi:beta-glucosidase